MPRSERPAAAARPGEMFGVPTDATNDVDRRRAEQALAAERRRLACLAETSDQLSASLNLDRCMEVVARLAVRHLTDAAVVIVSATDSELSSVIAGPGGDVTRAGMDRDAFPVPGLDEALRGYPPVPPRWVDPAELPGQLVPHDLDRDLQSAVIAPLPGHGMPAGALVLLGRVDPPVKKDELLLRLFATRAGSALSAARLYAEQARIATTLMRDLLPPRLHALDEVDYAAGYWASRDSEQVGGDFYDVHPGSGTGQPPFVVLGDVAGKGLDAAVLAGKIRNTLQALLPVSHDHHRLLELLNGALLRSRHHQFATLVLATVSRSSDQVDLRLTCAGHPAPLIVRADGRIEEADTHGTLVGALPTIECTSTVVSLMPGETCLLFTDGATDARGGPLGGETFGEQRLRDTLAGCAGLTASAVVERIQVVTSDWVAGGAHDDMAVVAITAPITPGNGS